MKEEEQDPQAEEKVCGACYIYTNTMTYLQARGDTRVAADCNKQEKGEDRISVRSAASLLEMPTVQDKTRNEPVNVLRDTGCTGVINKNL